MEDENDLLFDYVECEGSSDESDLVDMKFMCSIFIRNCWFFIRVKRNNSRVLNRKINCILLSVDICIFVRMKVGCDD